MKESSTAKNGFVFRQKKQPGSAYESDRKRLKEGFFGRLFARITPDVGEKLKMKMKVASFWENFSAAKFFSGFLDRFLKTRVRATAVGVLCFGFLCAAFTLLHIFMAGGAGESQIMELAFSLGVIVGGIPLALSHRVWHDALRSSVSVAVWTQYFGGYRGDEMERRGEYAHGGRFSVIAGVMLGVLSAFVSPLYIAAAILFLVVFLQIFYKPELALSLIVLLFTLVSDEFLLGLALAALLAFAFKAARGKRILMPEPTDIFVLFVFLLWGTGAIFGLSDIRLVCLGGVIYLLFAKLVRSARQAHRLSGIFVFGLFVYCGLYLLRYFSAHVQGEMIHRFFELLSPGTDAFVVPLEIVMMLLPIAAVGVLRGGAMKIFGFLSLAMGLCTLLFSEAPGAVFCFLISFVVLALILRKKMIPVCIGLGAVLTVILFLYRSAVPGLFSGIPALVNHALEEQKLIFTAVFDRNLFAVLFGDAALGDQSFTFWGDMVLRFGIVGVSAFLSALIFLFRKSVGYAIAQKDSQLTRLSVGLMLSVGMLLLRGLTAGFTDNGTVFTFFWLVCGMLCGVCEIERRGEGFKVF